MPRLTKIEVMTVEIYKHMRENKPVGLWNKHLPMRQALTSEKDTEYLVGLSVSPALKMHAYAKQN